MLENFRKKTLRNISIFSGNLFQIHCFSNHHPWPNGFCNFWAVGPQRWN